METEENVEKTYTDPITGRFIEGNPGGGRPKDTPEMKIIKRATKELIAEYKEALGESLPLIQPVLIAKALEGDMTAIKEIHDRVMDKSKQPTDITSDGKPMQIIVPPQLAEAFNIHASETTHKETS
jgi:hypothetical protein